MSIPIRGNSSFLENPSMSADTYNYYDLTFSLGTYNSNSTYDTGEVPCTLIYGNCYPSCDGTIITGGGGASMVGDGTGSGNVMIYHTWSGSNRIDLAGTTSQVNDNSSTCIDDSAALPIQPASEPVVTTPYHWQPRVVVPSLQNIVIGETSPSAADSSLPSTSTTPPVAPVTELTFANTPTGSG